MIRLKRFSNSKYITILQLTYLNRLENMSTLNTNNDMNNGFEEIVEGRASMIYNKNESVFYNKVQVLNRDLSIQVIKLFAEKVKSEKLAKLLRKKGAGEPFQDDYKFNGITVLDALAATGLRSIRYLKEIPDIRHVTINDIDATATDQAMKNIIRNEVTQERVSISNTDACLLMYQHRDPLLQYDVVDLDPYGTAAPFLDPAVQAVADGGLLCITCTDMPVLSGNYPETCYAKYGCLPIKGRYTHEMSLRILLHAIDTAANKYKRHIEPWISVSVDFYIRVFVRVFQSPAEVKNSCLKRSFVFQSKQCPSFYLQPMGLLQKGAYVGATATVPQICPETGGNMKIGGPFWSAPIHKQEIVDELLDHLTILENQNKMKKKNNEIDSSFPATFLRLFGLLTAISEEVKDAPLYYLLPDLASTVRVTCPILKDVQAGIINAGYRVSQFHREPNSIKTNAPADVVWDVIRGWCTKHAPEVFIKTKKTTAVAHSILSKIPKIQASFEIPEELSQPRKKATRFPPNPEINWGPKRRAGRLAKEIELNEREASLNTNNKVIDNIESGDNINSQGDNIDTINSEVTVDSKTNSPIGKRPRNAT